MKKLSVLVIAIILIGVAAVVYATRPVAVPAGDIQSVTNTLKPLDSSQTAVYRTGEGSKAEFQMNELLNGKPKLVVGTTTAIAGDIGITGNHIQLGEFKIDARTLTTDNANRNGAMNRLILKTGTAGNEYVTYRPTSNDFAGTIEEGKPVSFTTTGDLTVSGVTKPAAFKVVMTINGDTLSGKAETRIRRSDFGIAIPNLSFIANVDDEFPLFVDLVAKKVAQ